jgi:hypothetical protein
MVDRMYEMVMSDPDKRHYQTLLGYCKEWCSTHQWALGVGEMAIGAAVITWGLQTGNIDMGSHVVGSQWSHIGAGAGAGIGGLAASFIGSMGVAAMGGAIAIPAFALIGGGAAIFSAFGYSVGDMAQKFFQPPGGFGFTDASILAIGIALLVDGARRLISDEKVLALASRLQDGVIKLAKPTGKVIAKTWEELQAMIEKLEKHPDAKDATLGIASGVATATGAVIGGHIAAGSVTVLGSHGLGAAALSLGLISAPVWPVIAGGAAGLAVGLAGWKAVKHYRNK